MTWRPGDLLLLDNILAVHGRTAFEGERRVLAALIRDRAPQDTQPAGRSETERVEA